uniref:rRNA N-glycosylase n=1 Tax=Opuntia streptacantha TaxID=393608 RepID=A0A7C9D3L1_OPUST
MLHQQSYDSTPHRNSTVKMRKVVLLAAIISTWLTLIHAAGDTWDLSSNDANNYANFIGYIRGEVKGTTCFGIPMIRQPPTSPYLLVKLQSSGSNTIGLVLDKRDLYVLGYSDTFNGRPRAFYFKGTPTNAVPGAQVSSLWYTGSYQELQANAKITRQRLGLSKAIVNRLITNINGKAITSDALKKAQAQFLLIVVQMVAEAARFKYIETVIKDHYTQSFLEPNDKVLTIVKEWDKITTAIVNAKANGMFQSPLTLTGPNGSPYTVTKVDDVRNDMGILKYVAKPCAKTLSFEIFTGAALLAEA